VIGIRFQNRLVDSFRFGGLALFFERSRFLRLQVGRGLVTPSEEARMKALVAAQIKIDEALKALGVEEDEEVE
jgi:hypothetical protein